MEKEAESILKIICPTTPYERLETIAVLGDELSYKLLGIVPAEEDKSWSDVEIDQGQPESEPDESKYKRQVRLEAFLRQVRRETMFSPEDWNLPATIKFCFGDLFWLFDTKFNLTGQRQNFLSYGYFVNRILELHGRYELRDKLNIKEPKTDRVRRNNARLWRMYLEYLEKNHGYNIGRDGRH